MVDVDGCLAPGEAGEWNWEALIGVDKGQGVQWLAEETGIPPVHIGGIGDSPGDLKFLDLVGHSAAPANAAPEVKASVDYVSTYQDGDGVVDMLHQWL